MSGKAPSNWVAAVRRFVSAKTTVERCEFCSRELPVSHRHLIELSTRQLFCTCEECVSTLKADDKFRAVSPKTERLEHFHLTDSEWETMQFPIDIVFFFLSDDARPTAIYPSPAGGMESALSAQAWESLLEANPSLSDLSPHVEALLINRTKQARDYYRVSIDRCYALVGAIRTRWRGFAGGADVWNDVDDFFDALNTSAVNDGKAYLHG